MIFLDWHICCPLSSFPPSLYSPSALITDAASSPVRPQISCCQLFCLNCRCHWPQHIPGLPTYQRSPHLPSILRAERGGGAYHPSRRGDGRWGWVVCSWGGVVQRRQWGEGGARDGRLFQTGDVSVDGRVRVEWDVILKTDRERQRGLELIFKGTVQQRPASFSCWSLIGCHHRTLCSGSSDLW